MSPASRTADPVSQVLGMQSSKPGQSKPILPVTGSDTLPALMIAAACLVLGAGALMLSRKATARQARS